ncbi:hypothetical protein T03_10779 [Trichinella britovi]|uniref:Uncharacterized protein n=1 Tax=Trichinella britovi TaxID=45882 RepID=A0A0V0Z4E5_TRIBR|nr:hypothetical protein T03_10779 [Trichinella britovi]
MTVFGSSKETDHNKKAWFCYFLAIYYTFLKANPKMCGYIIMRFNLEAHHFNLRFMFGFTVCSMLSNHTNENHNNNH